MKPTPKPDKPGAELAYVRAAEEAVIHGLGKPNFWAWSRQERTRILLASLDSIPEGICSEVQELSLECFQLCFEAAWAAAHEVLVGRKRKKQQLRKR